MLLEAHHYEEFYSYQALGVSTIIMVMEIYQLQTSSWISMTQRLLLLLKFQF